MKLKYNNYETLFNLNQDYIIDRRNIEFIEAKINHRQIPEKHAYKALYAYANNLVYLNPQIDIKSLKSKISTINIKLSYKAIEEELILKICSEIWNKKTFETLKPILQNRSILFNPKLNISKENKSIITKRIIGYFKTKELIDKLIYIFKNWDFTLHPIITRQLIINNYKIGKNTLTKYSNIINGLINELNNYIKNNKYDNESVINIIDNNPLSTYTNTKLVEEGYFIDSVINKEKEFLYVDEGLINKEKEFLYVDEGYGELNTIDQLSKFFIDNNLDNRPIIINHILNSLKTKNFTVAQKKEFLLNLSTIQLKNTNNKLQTTSTLF